MSDGNHLLQVKPRQTWRSSNAEVLPACCNIRPFAQSAIAFSKHKSAVCIMRRDFSTEGLPAHTSSPRPPWASGKVPTNSIKILNKTPSTSPEGRHLACLLTKWKDTVSGLSHSPLKKTKGTNHADPGSRHQSDPSTSSIKSENVSDII